MIAYDNSALATLTVSSPSTFYTITGSNVTLIVNAFNLLGDGTDPSAITYKGFALTKLGTHTIAGITTGSLWYLSNAPTGPNTLALTTADDAYRCSIISFTGVLGGVGNFTAGVSTTHTCNISQTARANDMIVASTFADDACVSWTANGLTLGANNTTNSIAVGYVQSSTATVGFTANGGSIANMLTLGASVQDASTTTQTQAGKSRIIGPTNQTQLGKSNIRGITLQTILGKANIRGITLQTILGKANIGKPPTQWTPENKHSSIWRPETKHV